MEDTFRSVEHGIFDDYFIPSTRQPPTSTAWRALPRRSSQDSEAVGLSVLQELLGVSYWRCLPYLTSAGSSVTRTSVLQLARGLMDSSTGGTTKLLLTGSQRPWPKLKVDLQCKSFHWGSPWEAERKQKKGAPLLSLLGTFTISPLNWVPCIFCVQDTVLANFARTWVAIS